MFLEEIFNPTEDNNNDYYFKNIITSIKDRLYLDNIDIDATDIYKDELYFKLYQAIDYDVVSVDSYIGLSLKDTLLKSYVKIKSEKISKDELNELKWFILERLQGYMPCTHRLLYDL